jgi:hypothetical protein
MAITLITTVGGSTSDSYASADEFDTFLKRRRNGDDVLNMSPDKKAQGLLEAMTFLAPLHWPGSVVSATQALAHPRYGLPKPNSESLDYYSESSQSNLPIYYESTEIAPPVKNAQCELAYLILSEQFNTDESESAAIQSFSADGVSVNYATGARTRSKSGQLPPSVGRILAGLVMGTQFRLG